MNLNDKITAKITAINKYGIDIEFGNTPGFIQPIDISWDYKKKQPKSE